MSATRQKVLSLYKHLLREGKKFTTYNFRMYALRRTQDAFREHKLATPQEVSRLIQKAEHDLDVLRRQVIISQMYADRPVILEQDDHGHQTT